ncbi:MAG TPA: polysaccharide biosynthesis/export family protein [Candidatus Polarisedimenticolaceae bacterium]|nr:polysaccharide biosynthesis/export family protein [Candidatus Polarisedimenticolaceae bacterium]
MRYVLGFVLCLPLLAPLGAAEPPPAGAVQDDSFVIGIEDTLRVFVWGEPALSVSVKVRPDGKITVPLVNDVLVVGLTADEVRQRIASALATYLKSPNVTVIVDEINSFRVYFLGEVSHQGALQFLRPTRLLQAIATAGGLTQFSKKEISLVREENGVEKRLEIDYKRLLAGDPAQENLYLKPGDLLLFK